MIEEGPHKRESVADLLINTEEGKQILQEIHAYYIRRSEIMTFFNPKQEHEKSL